MSVVPMPLPPAALASRLAEFIADTARAAGRPRGVVGVSGGLDSATALLLAVRALGAANVLAVLAPYRTSSPDSVRDAQEVARTAGCRAETIDISPMVDAFRDATGTDDPLRLGNKMARERMCVLYDRAHRDRGLVIGTSNKTEILLGYATRWGDAAHDLNPLGDLYKCQVRALAEHLGAPRAIVEKPPSADLWPGQTDEGELGLTYDIADRVLAYLVDGNGRPERAAADLGVPPAMVRAIVDKVVRSQFKREGPRICKLQTRTVGIDWTLPPDWT